MTNLKFVILLVSLGASNRIQKKNVIEYKDEYKYWAQGLAPPPLFPSIPPSSGAVQQKAAAGEAAAGEAAACRGAALGDAAPPPVGAGA